MHICSSADKRIGATSDQSPDDGGRNRERKSSRLRNHDRFRKVCKNRYCKRKTQVILFEKQAQH